MIPVRITFNFTQDYRHTENCNFCIHSVVKWHEVAQAFMMVDYVREITAKESCKYGEYGLFEHLLFFCFVCCNELHCLDFA